MNREMLYYWNGVLLAIAFYFLGAFIEWSRDNNNFWFVLFLVFTIIAVIFSYIAMHKWIGKMEDDE